MGPPRLSSGLVLNQEWYRRVSATAMEEQCRRLSFRLTAVGGVPQFPILLKDKRGPDHGMSAQDTRMAERKGVN